MPSNELISDLPIIDPNVCSDRGASAENKITREDVERLKENWLYDPIWDIEETEGFESFHDELLAFRIEVKASRELKREKELDLKARKMGVSVETARKIQRLEYTVSAATQRAMRGFANVTLMDEDDAEHLINEIVKVAIASIKIEQMKETAISPTPLGLINIALECLHNSPFYRSRFTTHSYKYFSFKLDEKLWHETLSQMVQDGKLIQNFELIDPVGDDEVAVYHNYSDIPLDQIFSEEYPFVVTEKNITITYSFPKESI